MTEPERHLTEEERQSLADGTLPADKLPAVREHLRGCGSCAADVAGIESLMKRVIDAQAPTTELDDLWPSILSRIEKSKMVSLQRDGSIGAAPAQGRRHIGAWLVAAAAIAAVLVVALSIKIRPQADQGIQDQLNPATVAYIAAADSAREYEEQAQVLLNRLELQRATLRPETVHLIDKDLRVVDSAIAELEDAIAHDPRNPALRQLLASSYRQKVDILKRVGNAS